MKKFLLALLIVAGCSPYAFSQSADKKLPISPLVKKGKLANGLTYYIRKNAEPANRAELRLVVNAGSILETDAQRGLAHFTEHMAFNGTKNFKKQELVNFLERSGVNFGADLNAYTSFDETVYELQLPTDSPNVYRKGFQILEDWAHNVSFDNGEIDKERGVVIEEWRLGLGADERMRAQYFPVIFKGSQYATRMPIGTKQNLENFSYNTLKQFYKDWYRPNLQAVIVVGDVDVAETEKLIIQHFSRIPKPVNAKPRKKFTIPAQKGTAVSILTDPEQPYNVVQVYYKQPAIPQPQTDLQYRDMLVREMYNSMMNLRLQELGQKPGAPFMFANSSYGNVIANVDALTLFAVAKNGESIADATTVLLRENARVKQFGFTSTELDRAKAAMLSGIEALYSERDKSPSASHVQELVNNFLNKEPIPGIDYEYRLYKKYVPAITLKEVNSLVGKWIKQDDRAVIVMAPDSEKENIIRQKELVALLNKPFNHLEAYKDVVTDGALLMKEPVAGSIVSTKKLPAIGVTEMTLSNGVKLVLKPTSFKNNEIIFSAISAGGSSLYADSDYLSVANASGIAQMGGVGNFDAMSLQKYLSGKQVNVSPSIGAYAEGISGSSTPKDLETALQLVYGYFTEPRKDSLMFETMKQNIYASLVNKGKDPGGVFADSVSYIMGNYHPRRKPLTLDRMNELQLQKSFDAYKERYANAADFIFTFVGNFSVDSITPYIEKYIASLPSTATKETWKDVGLRYPTGRIDKVIRKGKESKATVRISYTGTTTYSDLEVTQLDQLAKVLEISLREQLREEQGGVYGVNVSAGIYREPINSYAITISFTCAPGNVEKLSNIVTAEIEKLKTTGAPQINIDKIIAEDTRALETEMKGNSYWLYNLEQKYYYHEDPVELLKDPALVKQLTVERTRQMANQYFNTPNVAKLVLMPEK